jgi:serine protease Do
MRRIKLIGLALSFILVMAVSGCTLPSFSTSPAPSGTPDIPPASPAAAAVSPTSSPILPSFTLPAVSAGVSTVPVQDFSAVISRVRPSVVAINTTISGMSIFGGQITQKSAGSGWIIDSSGLIVTNNHVVEGANSISVTLEDGRDFSIETVRADSTTDLAIIKINAQNLPPALKVGDSAKLQVGNWVVAIGNSLGQGISATKGIVSALGVSISADQGETLYDLIQTDAAINPGNSGGPLVNMNGEVIGINSVKVAQVGVEGMGYAISTQAAIPVINDLNANGYVTRPWLGVGLYTVDQTAVRQFRLGISKGVLVTQVAGGSPAAQAGLRQYDVITAIDGKDVTTQEGLVKIIRSYKIGQTVQITYWRGSTQGTASTTLIQAPTSTP